MPNEGSFRTEDMAMVSTLKYFGELPASVEWEGNGRGRCYWYFSKSDRLTNLTDGFIGRRLMVEPKQFNFLFGETKREFYNLADKARD